MEPLYYLDDGQLANSQYVPVHLDTGTKSRVLLLQVKPLSLESPKLLLQIFPLNQS
jgi:hypothetical protein